MIFYNVISQEQKLLDKTWKVRPLVYIVLLGCMKQPRNKELSLDEIIGSFQ